MLATAQEIRSLVSEWRFNTQEINDKADEIRKKNMEIKKETKPSHRGAIYTNRLLTNITNGKKLYYYFKQIS